MKKSPLPLHQSKNLFHSFRHVDEEAYHVVCLPVVANGEGIDNGVFFNNLRNKLNEHPLLKKSGIEIGKVLCYLTKLEGRETLENKGVAILIGRDTP